MPAKRAMWILAVPVVVGLMAVVTLGTLGIKPPGRTVSEVTPREISFAAPPDGEQLLH